MSSFTTAEKAEKPLKAKAYGSIGHLPNSRMGPADHHVHEGQAKICTEKARRGDRIIVTEKLDGSCMSVANVGGEIVPLTRSGYRASDVTYEHLRRFVPFVEQNYETFLALLCVGERICGEWIPMAHGTLYDPQDPRWSPFVAFDIFRDGKRVLFDEFCARTDRAGIRRAHVLHDYPTPICVDGALEKLGPLGHHGATEAVEGAVWRVERESRVDFLAKYVRPDKVDGKYFPDETRTPIWFVH
jgi:ATP-dependent RNA circularization protein (DNA/RNA ligase family)